MKYLPEILMLLSWPVLIYVSYKLSIMAIKFYDKKFSGQAE